MINYDSEIMEQLAPVEHFRLYNVLYKMVCMDKISKEEMESLLIKSGLTKIKEGVYLDESGSELTMNIVKQ